MTDIGSGTISGARLQADTTRAAHAHKHTHTLTCPHSYTDVGTCDLFEKPLEINISKNQQYNVTLLFPFLHFGGKISSCSDNG